MENYKNSWDWLISTNTNSTKLKILETTHVPSIPFHFFNLLVLHKACINDQQKLAEALIDIVEQQLKEIYKKDEKVRGMMKFWVNAKTDEGFTSMHFSSFKGNTVLTFKLFH